MLIWNWDSCTYSGIITSSISTAFDNLDRAVQTTSRG